MAGWGSGLECNLDPAASVRVDPDCESENNRGLARLSVSDFGPGSHCDVASTDYVRWSAARWTGAETAIVTGTLIWSVGESMGMVSACATVREKVICTASFTGGPDADRLIGRTAVFGSRCSGDCLIGSCSAS